jgi:hypothetical protein
LKEKIVELGVPAQPMALDNLPEDLKAHLSGLAELDDGGNFKIMRRHKLWFLLSF